jgi:hypothetical protein
MSARRHSPSFAAEPPETQLSIPAIFPIALILR